MTQRLKSGIVQECAGLGRIALALACAGIAAAPLAVAAPPKAAAAAPQAKVLQVNAQELGVVDRALEFCGPVDADSAKKLKDKVAELTKGASADAVAQARGSDVYKQAYSSMGSFIDQIDPRNAKVACTNTADKK
jgi:hypothetical protein